MVVDMAKVLLQNTKIRIYAGTRVTQFNQLVNVPYILPYRWISFPQCITLARFPAVGSETGVKPDSHALPCVNQYSERELHEPRRPSQHQRALPDPLNGHTLVKQCRSNRLYWAA